MPVSQKLVLELVKVEAGIGRKERRCSPCCQYLGNGIHHEVVQVGCK